MSIRPLNPCHQHAITSLRHRTPLVTLPDCHVALFHSLRKYTSSCSMSIKTSTRPHLVKKRRCSDCKTWTANSSLHSAEEPPKQYRRNTQLSTLCQFAHEHLIGHLIALKPTDVGIAQNIHQGLHLPAPRIRRPSTAYYAEVQEPWPHSFPF